MSGSVPVVTWRDERKSAAEGRYKIINGKHKLISTDIRKETQAYVIIVIIVINVIVSCDSFPDG